MGLEDLDGMGVPDNKGGRPNTTDDETRQRVSSGDPHTLNKESEGWWELKFNSWKGKSDNIKSAIQNMSEEVFINPIIIRKKLDEYGIYETDWADYVEQYPVYEEDLRIRDELVEAGVLPESRSLSNIGSDTLFDTGSDSDSKDVSGGLQSMLE